MRSASTTLYGRWRDQFVVVVPNIHKDAIVEGYVIFKRDFELTRRLAVGVVELAVFGDILKRCDLIRGTARAVLVLRGATSILFGKVTFLFV